MGNSEVGHMNIGAGRIVYQSLTRINKSIEDGDFYENEVLGKALNTLKITIQITCIWFTFRWRCSQSLQTFICIIRTC